MIWHINSIFYELYPRAFMDGDGDGHGDFEGLRQRLEYLQWLGVDCIWLTPIFPSPLRDDGYDISSFYGIHPKFGVLEDFRLTVDEIHRRGMRVILDLVVNHTSDDHPWFREARRTKDSPMRDYFVWNDDAEKYKDARIIFLDTETSNWAYDERTSQYYWHRFFSSQPDLNYDNPLVRQEMLNIMQFWLDIGIDGFRVDAVPYLIERDGTNSENLPETHDFLREMRSYIDASYRSRLLLAEANQWPQDLMPYFGEPGQEEFHMCFNFPLMPRLYMALARADRTCVIDIVKDTPAIPAGTQWAIFLRNHDELTLEMVTEEERQYMWETYAPEPPQRINLGIRRRLATLMGNDRRKIELMNSLLFTLPGAPVLYYGDEIGMGDNVSLPDRNGVRTPMQWSAEDNGGFSTAASNTLYSPPISDPDYGYSHVNVAAQRDDPTSLLNSIRRMILARKAHSLFANGDLTWWDELPNELLCFWRHMGDVRVLALHNLSDEPKRITLPEGEIWKDMLTEAVVRVSGEVELPPYGYRWLITVF